MDTHEVAAAFETILIGVGQKQEVVHFLLKDGPDKVADSLARRDGV